MAFANQHVLMLFTRSQTYIQQYQIRLQTEEWPVAASLAWMTPWNHVIVQATQMTMTVAAANPLDMSITTGCGQDPRHPYGLRPQTST